MITPSSAGGRPTPRTSTAEGGLGGILQPRCPFKGAARHVARLAVQQGAPPGAALCAHGLHAWRRFAPYTGPPPPLPLLLLLLVIPLVSRAAPSEAARTFGSIKCQRAVPNRAPWAVDAPGEPQARQPCVGYLIGIGVQKGGTSALWQYILCGAHPRIWAMSQYKEMVWFDWLHTEGATLRDYNYQMGKHLSPAANLHMLCPKPQSTVFRSAVAEGRRRCKDLKKLYAGLRCKLREQSPLAGMVPEDRGVAPYNISSLRPAPFYLTDISPSYMMHPDAPINVRSIVPEARLVIMLRDPVARAASAFNMVWQERRKQKDRDSEEAFQKAFTDDTMWEIKLLESCYSQALAKAGNSDAGRSLPLQGPDLLPCLGIGPSTMWTSMDEHSSRFENDYKDFPLPLWRNVMYGIYADILSLWFHLFPKEQIMLWTSDDFKADPVRHLDELVSWLGLDGNLTAKIQTTPSHERDYRFALPRETVEALRTFYRPHNQRLFDLLRAKGFGAQAARLEELWQ